VNATLVGTVFDSTSAAVPNARIIATNKGTNVSREVSGNERGDYIVANLAPGFYQIVAEHQGFRRTVVGQIELLVNQTARVDLVLQVALSLRRSRSAQPPRWSSQKQVPSAR